MLRAALIALPLAFSGHAAADILTYDNLPLGELETPMILRTYLPDPGLGDEVFANHGKGAPSPKYNVGSGKDSKGEFKPIRGIPAAIAVNHGPALSYAFDTVECRLLYAWQGGFLDMYPYWGPEKGGGRRSFDYVPRLTGTLFYKAEGQHPLSAGGKPVSEAKDLTFVGYDLNENGDPTFIFKAHGKTFRQSIEPHEDLPLSCKVTISCSDGDFAYKTQPLDLDDTKPLEKHELETAGNDGADDHPLSFVIKGKSLSNHNGFERNLKIKKATAAAGSDVFMNYGCIACHSTDGSLGHGPSLKNLFGSKREFEGAEKAVTADEDYIRESIMKPNAKTVKGFPPNYMPPYPLKPIELEAVLLYIKSLRDE